eukprot:1148872-Pelagomonas_calceolata.AAC.1
MKGDAKQCWLAFSEARGGSRARVCWTRPLDSSVLIAVSSSIKGASGGGCWARGSGEREKESPGVQEHGGQPA